MAPLGSALPEVELSDLDGRPVSLRQYANGHPVLVSFSANHCPYVRWVEVRLSEIVAAHPDVRVVAIGSNDIAAYPDDGPDGLREQAARANWSFPYLLDEDQQAARIFGAACTPDFFLYNAQGELAYRGAFDTSTPKNGNPLNGELLDAALARVESGHAVPEPHRPSMGCSIKWKQS